MLSAIKTQVLVVGAGAAGVNAAIAAARNGAATLLLEKHGFLGGVSSTLTWLGFHDQDYRLAVKGLPLEIARRMQDARAAAEFAFDPKVGSVLSLDGHYWKCLAMLMVREAGAKVLLDTRMVDTLREDDRIRGVIVEHKSGRQPIEADVTIDCSGDGDVAARGGVEWEKGSTATGELQAPTLVFRLGGADRGAFVAACKDPRYSFRDMVNPYPEVREKLLRHLDSLPVFLANGFQSFVDQARQRGEYDIPQLRVNLIALHRPDEFSVIMTKVAGVDPTDVTSLSGAYEEVYRQVPLLVRFFRNRVPGFAEARLIDIAPLLGVRESRRVMGDYVLTAEDLSSGRQFDDTVALSGYQIDIHRPDGSVVLRNLETYDIPYRSLVARGVDGLLVAGKCISATHEAISSTRVVPVCMALGQAVGTAAALAVDKGLTPREVDVPTLRARLIGQGVELRQTLGEPNAEIIEKLGRVPLDR
jgi:hypothetical protein